MDKSWIDLPISHRFSEAYVNGVKQFLDFAYSKVELGATTPCPCVKCNNFVSHNRETIRNHLMVDGIVPTYKIWVDHGETFPVIDNSGDVEEDNMDEMLYDIFGGAYGDQLGEESVQGSKDAHTFASLASDAKSEVYPGCISFSKLSFIVKLLHMTSMNKCSQKFVTELLVFLKQLLPHGANIPASFYEARKLMRDLGLDYVKIEACLNDCVIYWGPNEDSTICPTCGESRWKGTGVNGTKVPHKVLRYFPIKQRLQRLFINKGIASDMRWHKEKRLEEGNVMRHPADGQAWKDFDEKHQSFASDPRNIRLALSSDGFNPYSNMSTTYSMWPVVLINYNLPPWKSMKQPFFLLSMLIPGPKSPGNDIDVFLQPLVKDLKDMWEHGLETFDASNGSTFQLRAALMWTISDFPGYANLAGCTNKGKKACPCCGEETCYVYLKKGHKTVYMSHRRFLPTGHKWRRNASESAFDGTEEHRIPPKDLSGADIVRQLDKCRVVVFGKSKGGTGKRKREPYESNWTKRSIFYELPYWSTLLLRHNLDVMHIEKNIAESILGTILGIPGKNKDTVASRQDLELMKLKSSLHLFKRGDKMVMPPATYTLSDAERRDICGFWEKLKLPDGYSSNISRCISYGDGRLSGMKSHDYHIFLQRLLPFSIHAYVPKEVYEPIIELGLFFRELCARTLKVDSLERLEQSVAVTLCKLERVFPPSFFDVMIHLPIHLAREAILGGPSTFRWMYFVERCMHTYKQYVTNKAHPEGSIAEAYVFNETLTFCSMYLHDVETRHNRQGRNDDDGDHEDGISVFRYNGRLPRNLNYQTLGHVVRDKLHMYILNNCGEIEPYVKEHKELLISESLEDVITRHAERFPYWFELRMRGVVQPLADDIRLQQLIALSWGPDSRVLHYKRCIINGYRFHTKQLEMKRKTQNSGVRLVCDHQGQDIDFYGVLRDIIEVDYGGYKVVIFSCDWWNLHRKKGLDGMHVGDHGQISVNTSSKWYKDQPYALATQVKQVYYVPDVKLGGSWQVVTENPPRDGYDIPELGDDDDHDDLEGEQYVPYQEVAGNDFEVSMLVDNNDVQLRRTDLPLRELD